MTKKSIIITKSSKDLSTKRQTIYFIAAEIVIFIFAAIAMAFYTKHIN